MICVIASVWWAMSGYNVAMIPIIKLALALGDASYRVCEESLGKIDPEVTCGQLRNEEIGTYLN